MKEIKIDLADPFEVILTKLLSVPLTTDVQALSEGEDSQPQAKVKEVLRRLYEAAHGRQVATSIGLVALAPPLAAYLKKAPFYIKTQASFLRQALARLEAGPPPRAVAAPPAARPELPTHRRSLFSRPTLRTSDNFAVSGTTK